MKEDTRFEAPCMTNIYYTCNGVKKNCWGRTGFLRTWNRPTEVQSAERQRLTCRWWRANCTAVAICKTELCPDTDKATQCKRFMKGTSGTHKEYTLLRLCSLPCVIRLHAVTQLVNKMASVYSTVSVICRCCIMANHVVFRMRLLVRSPSLKYMLRKLWIYFLNVNLNIS